MTFVRTEVRQFVSNAAGLLLHVMKGGVMALPVPMMQEMCLARRRDVWMVLAATI